MNKSKATVSVVTTKNDPSLENIKDALKKILLALGGIESFVPRGGTVLIKPNVGTEATMESGTVTDYRVVEALINLLFEAGVGRILIAEASAVGTDTTEAFITAGFVDLAKRTGVELIDLKNETIIEKLVPKGLAFNKIEVYQRAFDCDALINVPTLKTIFSVPVSLGMKNLKGLLPDHQKRRFHHVNLNNAIVDLNMVIKPSLTIIDGIIGSELYEPKIANILLASPDIVAVDTVASLIMGVDPNSVEYLKLASEQGLGISEIKRINVVGEEINKVLQQFNYASSNVDGFKSLYPEVDIVDGAACSGCVNVLNYVLKTAKKRGLLEKRKGLAIAIGPRAKSIEREMIIYVGNCLSQYRDKQFIPGCPFISMELLDFLENN